MPTDEELTIPIAPGHCGSCTARGESESMTIEEVASEAFVELLESGYEEDRGRRFRGSIN